MFKTRLISGIVLVVLALVFIIAGGDLLMGVMLAISLIGMFELNRVFECEKSIPAFLAYGATIGYYLLVRFQMKQHLEALTVVFLLLLLGAFVLSYPKFHSKQIMAVFFGFFYIGIMLSFLYQTRVFLNNGKYLVWLIFLCSWGCDTSAYCVGVLFGKHKMSPILSPKKSVEGAVGGVVGSILLTALYCYIFKSNMGISTEALWLLACFAGIGALASMIGDLAASAIKRNYDIKDYGKLIPGHGGIMDRFDSMIITAPIVYFLCVLAATINL